MSFLPFPDHRSSDRQQNASAVVATARAFVIYSLVPYLGILFCPGALLLGGIGVFRSYQTPLANGRTSSYLTIIVGLLVMITQLLLWWAMYKIPEWAKTF